MIFTLLSAGIVLLSLIYLFSDKEITVLGYTFGGGEHEEGHLIRAHYRNTETFAWESEERSVPFAHYAEMVKSVLDELKAGSRNAKLAASIPDSLGPPEVLLTTEGAGTRNVIMNFNDSFHLLDEMQKADLITSLVWTLTELWFVEGVYISTGGEPLTLSFDSPMGQLTRNNVLKDVKIPAAANFVTTTLYFPNRSGGGLIAEVRDINRRAGDPELLEGIMDELFAGPRSTGLVPIIPRETRLNSIYREEIVCYVDLSADFVNRLGGEAEARLAVMSVVNSLTERQNIRRVQILIDGARVEVEGWGTFDLSERFERDEGIILE
jgi:spore germination protein GerM